ncbi:AEC family transporter [Oceanobacillus sp. Castelsardo]|uniref:AEC family transporter n=1 Tax=Oceanobacillus sp. Castelsardo TaxID=1851204 RepID=UPI000837F5FE|nr:AEC family transporter [Oceanobacillus sp. Castelsardo]
MNQEFLYVIAIIMLGYLLKRFNILEEKDGQIISKIIFKITFPALIFVTFNTVKIEASLIYIPIIIFIYGLVATFIALWVFKNKEKEIKGSFMMISSGFNVGLFAFPLVFAIWGMNGLTHFSMFDVGNSMITLGIAYILGSYFSKEGLSLKPVEIFKKLGQSIPLMAYVVASILNLTQIKLPIFIIEVAEIISAANIPLSLLLLGIFLNFRFDKQFMKPMLKYLTFRYALGLLFGVILFFVLPFDEMYRYTLLIGLLLPIASSAITYAVEFKYSMDSIRLIATTSNITVLVSMVILYVFANFIPH